MDADEVARAQVGRTIGDRYRLLGLLGSGGMGAVYLAEHVFTKRHVALKRMHPEYAHSKQAAERFVRESRAPSAIGHPGIVQVLDGGEDADGSLYLVLELLDGVSLHEAIEQKALDAGAVVQIGVELLEALAAAHDKGFVHRDIKPDNVYLTHDGRGGVAVKLLDFGIAALRDTEGSASLTRTGSVLGTPMYMSPEQAKGERVDARSDLWAVGALLYRALAGRAPYTADTEIALIVSIVTKQHAPLSESRPDLPDALLHAVERALSKSPEDRFDSAEAMCAAIKAATVGPASSSLPPYASLRAAADPRPSAALTRQGATREGSPLPAATRAARGPLRRASETPAPFQPAAPRPRDTSQRGPQPVPVVAQLADAPDPRVPQAMRRRSRVPERLAGLALLSLCLGSVVFLWRARSLDSHAALSLFKATSAVSDIPTTGESRAPEPVEVSQPSTAEAIVPERDRAEAATQQAVRPERAVPTMEGLHAEDLTRVLAQHQAALERCLQEAVVAQMLAGADKVEPFRLDVTLQIAPVGRVTEVEIAGRAPTDLSACLRARLSALVFPAAAASTQFHYPLVLAPRIVGS